MRRSFASDTFYRSIFTEYVQQILCIGDRPVEFFPEGTRSRSGKALQPKLGKYIKVKSYAFLFSLKHQRMFYLNQVEGRVVRVNYLYLQALKSFTSRNVQNIKQKTNSE